MCVSNLSGIPFFDPRASVRLKREGIRNVNIEISMKIQITKFKSYVEINHARIRALTFGIP